MLPTVPQADDSATILTTATSALLAAFFSGRSHHTIAAYRADLDDFRAFVSAATVEAAAARLLNGTNGEANGLALAWRAHLAGRGMSPATINRRLSALRALTALGRTLGLITWKIEIQNVRAAAYRDTRGPQRAGVIALLAAAAAQTVPGKAARDGALLRLLHDTALRRGEVCKLDLADVDLPGSRIWIVGKGRVEKVAITLPPQTRAALAAWIDVRGFDAGPLFVRLDNAAEAGAAGRLTGSGVWCIVSGLGTVAGIKTRPHGLRHSAITAALDATNGDVRRVKRFSRHSDPRTLLIYDDCRRDLGGEVAALIAA